MADLAAIHEIRLDAGRGVVVKRFRSWIAASLSARRPPPGQLVYRPLSGLAHSHAVLTARLWLQANPAWSQGQIPASDSEDDRTCSDEQAACWHSHG
jgi:hypothetical protein